ncbi:hypothetical protein [Microbacterium sp.]|uniref:hypothetical protein n=1 Tax=Microbacterium sp. TaxID=51671 RepID=UPI00281193F2|nr:hypothetical protein [Microbacterium sp.]
MLAILAGATSVLSLASLDESVLMAEIWRAIGLLTFAGIFTFIAFRPMTSPALWLIVIANKLVLTAAALGLGAGIPGALEAVAWDGALVIILGAGFAASLVARRVPDGVTRWRATERSRG